MTHPTPHDDPTHDADGEIRPGRWHPTRAARPLVLRPFWRRHHGTLFVVGILACLAALAVRSDYMSDVHTITNAMQEREEAFATLTIEGVQDATSATTTRHAWSRVRPIGLGL